MELRVETTPDDPSRGAVLYGPIVLAGQLGTEGMQAPAPFSDPTVRNDYYTYDYHIPAGLADTLAIDPAHPSRTLRREGPGLTFTTPRRPAPRPPLRHPPPSLHRLLAPAVAAPRDMRGVRDIRGRGRCCRTSDCRDAPPVRPRKHQRTKVGTHPGASAH